MEQARPLGHNEAHCKMSHHYQGGNGTFTLYCRLKGAMDKDRLLNALACVVAENGILSATFTDLTSLHFNQINGVRVDLSELPFELIDNPAEGDWQPLYQQLLNQPMAYDGSHLWKVVLLQNVAGNGQCHELLVSFHHAIFDGRSLFLLMEQWFKRYQQGLSEVKGPAALPPDVESLIRNKMSRKRYFFNQMKYWFKTLPIKKTRLDWVDAAPIDERQTETVFECIDGIKPLLAACKQKGATLGSLIAAAVLKSAADYCRNNNLSQSCGLKLVTPFDLRSVVGDSAAGQTMGNYISSVHTFHKVTSSTDIWRLAEDYKDELSGGILSRSFNLVDSDPSQTTAGYHTAKNLGGSHFNGGLGVTNLGIAQFDRLAFDIEELKFSSNRQAGNFLVTAHIITLGDKLYLSFAYTAPLLDRQSAEAIARGSVEALRAI